jgi:hypothetical protein
MQRTTIRLEEHLFVQAKEYASRNRQSLTAVIEDALRALLARSHRGGKAPAAERRFRLPVSKEKGGLLPGINVDSNRELLDVMERGLPLDKLR